MKFARPINTHGKPAKISQSFSWRHNGVDYAYPSGETVFAAQDGIVTIANDKYNGSWTVPVNPITKRLIRALTTADYGNLIKIQHAYGFSTIYAHLRRGTLLVKVGDKVKKGQPIAQLNNSGNSTGAHLHWELLLNGKRVDPAPYVDYSFTKYL